MSTLHALSSHKSIHNQITITLPKESEEGEEEGSSQSVYQEEMALGGGSPASYIHMVHHLIEKCMTFGMSMEECMEALSKRADVQPVVTSTVWKELENENKEFFEKYKQWRSEKEGLRSSSSSSS